MIESVAHIDGGALVGILTTPNVHTKKSGAAAILFNAGIVHRIGAHRLNVKIARRLAALGMPALRFDLSGLGDSPPAEQASGFEEQAVMDVQRAIDAAAEQTGADRFVVIGMCSGADHGYRSALVDKRIAGLILMDPYAYAHPSAKAADIVRRAMEPDRWVRKAKSILNKSLPDDRQAPDEQSRPVPAREEFGRDLALLVARKVEILILYTGFVRSFLLKPEHFFETFDEHNLAGGVTVKLNLDADHTYTTLASQRELLNSIEEWIGGADLTHKDAR
ncbi:MAG: alpha/beta fold hydrolase [Pseudomonadota bacterium]